MGMSHFKKVLSMDFKLFIYPSTATFLSPPTFLCEFFEPNVCLSCLPPVICLHWIILRQR